MRTSVASRWCPARVTARQVRSRPTPTSPAAGTGRPTWRATRCSTAPSTRSPPHQYERWLRSWGVRFVVLPVSTPDYASLREAQLVRSGLPFLHRVWSDEIWTLYEVTEPAPMASAPATLIDWNAAAATVSVPTAGSTVLRIAWSPWLSIVDEKGHRVPDDELAGSCLDQLPATRSRRVPWVVLHVTQPGTYRHRSAVRADPWNPLPVLSQGPEGSRGEAHPTRAVWRLSLQTT